jgi:Protein of unknown function (DUF3618)
MATADNRTTEEVRRDIESERERLADAVDDLRSGLDPGSMLKGKLPVAAAAAFGAGFLLSGGIGATMRLIFRRGREGDEKARFGRFSFVDRD